MEYYSWALEATASRYRVRDVDQGSFTLVDVSFFWVSTDDRYQVGVHGRNLSD